MPNWLKSAIKYLFTLAIGGAMLYFTFRDKDLHKMYLEIKAADFSWVFLSFAIALLSHLARAYRWNLLMEPLDYKPTVFRSFLAVMVGYLANIFIPRMGEVSRCAILQKTDNIPLSTSFGTVVIERVFDLLTLISVIFLAFFIEFDRLSTFVFTLFSNKFSGPVNQGYIYIGVGSILLGLLIITIFAKVVIAKINTHSLFLKIKAFLGGLGEGVMSFRKLKRKKEFFIATFIIWLGYFFMTYVVFYSLPATSMLGVNAGLALLVLGGIGMAAPVQGGIGAFHWVIQQGLVLYGVSATQGLTFATIVHSSQMIMVFVVGLISLIITMFLGKKRSPSVELQENENSRQNTAA